MLTIIFFKLVRRTLYLFTAPSATTVMPAGRVARVMLGPVPNKKASNYSSRLVQTSRSSVASRCHTPYARTAVPESPVMSGSDVDTESGKEKSGKPQGAGGAVTLECLVEMLKVVQKFPAGSNLHTSILQLVEEMVKSMKENIASPCKPEVDDEPLTFFPTMPSTISSVPRIARVAPVAPVAPTTVVSSPGLTRTVRVCVTEAPNIVQEPLAKKPREDILPMDYQLMENNQLRQELGTPCTVPVTVATHIPVCSSLNTVTPLVSQKVISNQGSSPDTLSSVSSGKYVTTCPLDVSGSQVVSASTVIAAKHISETQISPQSAVYQPVSQQPVLHNINQAVSQCESQPLSVGQSIIQAAPQTTCLATTQEESQPNQTSPQSRRQITTSQEPLSTQSDLPPSVSDPLLPQAAAGMCSLLPSSLVVTTAAIAHESMATTTSVASSLTYSDPLLSQTSPVSHMQIETNRPAPTTSSDPVNTRDKGNTLLPPNAAATQVSMQNEVSTTINLSETELLNYFDPNCFDNGK